MKRILTLFFFLSACGSNFASNSVAPKGEEFNEEKAFSLTLVFPFSHLIFYDAELKVRGQSLNAKYVFVNGIKANTENDFVTWEVSIPIPIGESKVEVVAEDFNGNQSRVTQGITRNIRVGTSHIYVDGERKKGWAISRSYNKIIEFDLESGAKKQIARFEGELDWWESMASYDRTNGYLYYNVDSGIHGIDTQSKKSVFYHIYEPKCVAHGKGNLFATRERDFFLLNKNGGRHVLGKKLKEDCYAMFYDHDETRLIVVLISNVGRETKYELVSIDGTTWAMDYLGEIGRGNRVPAFSWDEKGNRLFSVNFPTFKVISKNNIVRSIEPELQTNSAYDPITKFIYRIDHAGVYQIDLNTKKEKQLNFSRLSTTKNIPYIDNVIPFKDSLRVISDKTYTLDYDPRITKVGDAVPALLDRVDDTLYSINPKHILVENLLSGKIRKIDISDQPTSKAYQGSFEVDINSQQYFIAGFNMLNVYNNMGKEIFSESISSGIASRTQILWRKDHLLLVEDHRIHKVNFEMNSLEALESSPELDHVMGIGDFDENTILVWSNVDGSYLNKNGDLVFFQPENNKIVRRIRIPKNYAEIFGQETHRDLKQGRIWFANGAFVDLVSGQFSYFVQGISPFEKRFF